MRLENGQISHGGPQGSATKDSVQGDSVGTAGPGKSRHDAHRIALQRVALRPVKQGGEASPLPPLELLSAATGLREHQALRRGAPPRLILSDSATELGGASSPITSTKAGPNAGPDSADEATARTLAFGPDLVLVGAESTQLPGRSGRREEPWLEHLSDTGSRLKGRDAQGPVRVLWINEETDAAASLLENGAADLVVRGEADESMPSLVEEAIAGRRDWSGSRGVSWMQNGKVRHEREGSTPLRLTAPAWDLIDLSLYSGTEGAGWLASTRLGAHLGTHLGTWSERLIGQLPDPIRGRLGRPRQGSDDESSPASPRRRSHHHKATIFTTRACPPDCPTCHGSFGSHGRERPVGEIVRELRELVQKHGVRHIAIGDRAFDGQPARARKITEAIAKLRSAPGYGRLTMSFPQGLRGDGLTPELIDALRRAGVTMLPLRVTTASPRLQRLLKENIQLPKVHDALQHMAQRGVRGHLMLRLGLPTETVGEAAHTIRWARGTQATTADFENGREIDLGPAWTGVDSGDIDDFPGLRRRALTAFYSSPGRAGRLVKAFPSSVVHALQRRR